MAELIAIGYPEEARACHARDEVNQLIIRPDESHHPELLGKHLGRHQPLRADRGGGRRCRARGLRRHDRQDRDRPGVSGPRPGHGQARSLHSGRDGEQQRLGQGRGGLSRYGGTILESSLSPDSEWRLQEALRGKSAR
jgi:hypothetical protein